MTTAGTTFVPLGSYRNETPYPFCPGCGHGPILDGLNTALLQLQADPRLVVLVSDIGCSGLSDQYFDTSAFHGLHGRSITYASGIKLAQPALDVVVIMGDGGAGIGGAHLINAARRNIGITVLVFNNLNFGMTGGQHSVTTPSGAVTSTTPEGHLERPLDICTTVGANGAQYVYRGTSFDEELPKRIAEAMRCGGFGLLDIWELCTAYFVRTNKLSRATLRRTLEELEFPTGVLYRKQQPEYAAAYRQVYGEHRTGHLTAPLPQKYRSGLDRRLTLVVAGSAGGKVRSAVRLMGGAAIMSGLWAAQRDDYPVTVKTGHSLSVLVLAPEEIHYSGVTAPDALLVLTEDGRRKAARYLGGMTADQTVFVTPEFAGVDTAATVEVLDPAAAPVRLGKADMATAVLAAVARRLDLFPIAALEEAARLQEGRFAARSLQAIEAGVHLA